MHNTIPSSMYLFNHGLHGFGDWESLPLIGAIGIKKNLYCFLWTQSLSISTMLCLYLWIKKYLVILVLLSAFCCYLSIRLPFIEVLSFLTKAFLNLLQADRPYTYIAKYIKRVMYMYAAQCFPHCVYKRKCPHRWNSNWMHIYYTST